MKEHGSRVACHARVAICRTCCYTLKERKDSTHLRYIIQRCNKVHLRGARVAEYDVNACIYECAN